MKRYLFLCLLVALLAMLGCDRQQPQPYSPTSGGLNSFTYIGQATSFFGPPDRVTPSGNRTSTYVWQYAYYGPSSSVGMGYGGAAVYYCRVRFLAASDGGILTSSQEGNICDRYISNPGSLPARNIDFPSTSSAPSAPRKGGYSDLPSASSGGDNGAPPPPPAP